MSANPPATSYDEVPYPEYVFAQTHPDRLATIAKLHGMEAAPASACRLLELGCGAGGNLIPTAYQLPQARFLGVDLSAESIGRGRRTVAALGLKNIELLHSDIMAIGRELGAFDYIVAHGVYSWVPQRVRAKLLDVLAANLAERGIGYVSYNCLPGSHLRGMAREAMLFHIRGIAEPALRVAQARTIIRLLAEAATPDTIYGAVMRDQIARLDKMPDELLFHDDLEPVMAPFLFHQVAEAAEERGLQYLAEATFSHGQAEHPGAMGKALAAVPDEEAVTREQYLDFVEGRMFRQSLFCRAGLALRRRRAPEQIREFHLAAGITAAGPVDPAAEGMVEFRTEDDQEIATDHRLSKAALVELGARWPEAVAFAELVERALDRLGAARAQVEGRRAEELEALTKVMFRSVGAGFIDLHLDPPRLTARIGERPRASAYARHQAKTAPIVTSLRHGAVLLTDGVVRRFLGLVDGSRDLDALVRDLRAALAADPPEPAAGEDGAAPALPEITPEAVTRNLQILAKLALLEAP